MQTTEQLYNAYDSDPIAWMKEHNCTTSKQITIKLMEQFGLELMLERNLNELIEKEEEMNPTIVHQDLFAEWYYEKFGYIFQEPNNPDEERINDNNVKEFKKHCTAVNEGWI